MQAGKRVSVQEVARTDLRSIERLTVWQRAIELVIEIYRLTRQFPAAERYDLTSQLRRAAVSIPSNIAEGHARNSRREFLQFLGHEFASSVEVCAQLVIAERVGLATQQELVKTDGLLSEVQRMLMSTQRALRAKS